MANFGLLSTGFALKRLPDILADIEDDEREAFGDVNLLPDSVFGQINGVFAKPCADVWEAVQAAYNGYVPSAADGAALSNVLFLNGLTRLAPSESIVNAIVDGDEAATITAGNQASTEPEGDVYELQSDVSVSKSAVLKAQISVDAVAAQTYTVTIDGTPCDFVAAGTETKAEIATGLKNSINATVTDQTASVNSEDDEKVDVVVDDKQTPFSIDVNTNLSIMERWAAAVFKAILTGPQLVPAGTLTKIETPQAGWNGVDNLVDGIPGRDYETDAEARLRRVSSLRVIGAGTLESIRSRILDTVTGVTAVAAFENRTDVTDGEGRPPHSFEMVVSGGADQDIINLLWLVKPAGIQTHGTESGQATDSNGDLQTLNFSRAVPKYVHLRVTINSYYSEEELPTNWQTLLKDELVAYGDALPLGKDLIIQRWYTPVYEVPGLASVTVEHDVTDTPGGSPSWKTTNIAIGPTAEANMDAGRITIVP